MMISRYLVLTSALGMAWLFAGCDGSSFNKVEEQYAEMQYVFRELKEKEWLAEELWDIAEAEQLLQHYAETQDASYATPKHKLTMLHLACLFKKPALVLHLLNNGADANAATTDDEGAPADTPLRFAISPGVTEADTDEISAQIIDILIKHGARAHGSISHGEGLLSAAAAVCDSPAVVEHLLHYAPRPTVSDLAAFLERGWIEIVTAELRTYSELSAEQKALIIAAAAPSPAISPEVNKRCIDALLELGIDINTTSPQMGETALFTAAAYLDMLTDPQQRQQWVDFIAYLLSKGADPARTIRMDASPGQNLCAYDLLAAKPEVLAELQQRGHHLQAPQLVFRPGAELPATLCRAGMRHLSAEEARPHLDTIATIFTPTAEQLDNADLAEALLSAAKILARADAAKASAIINGSSVWQIEPCHHHPNEECHHTVSAGTLVYAAAEVPGIVIDKQKLLGIAAQSAQNGHAELAALAVELLGRCPDAAAELEAFGNSPHLPSCAGAWQAKLQQAGLPKASNAGVANWLAAHGVKPDTPAVQTALAATSLDEMWTGQLTPERRNELIQALKDVGAPQEAISVYGQYIDSMAHPEQLDELAAQGNEWSYKLEIATAKFILQHAQEFMQLLQTQTK